LFPENLVWKSGLKMRNTSRSYSRTLANKASNRVLHCIIFASFVSF